MMNLNVTNVNKICTDISILLQESLDNKNNTRFNVRLGSLTGSKLLIGRGPNVEIIMETAGDIETNIESEFLSAGINQTLHKIYIDIRCHINLLTAYKDTKEEISVQVLLAEAVIVGNIPDAYYNFNNMPAEETLNMMQ